MSWHEDSFIFYRSYYEALSHLDDADRCRMYDAITDFSLNGTEPKELNGVCAAMWCIIKPLLVSVQDKRVANRSNGKKGGAPKNNKNASKNNPKTTQKQPKTNLIDNSIIDNSKLVIDNSECNSARTIIEDYQNNHALWRENLMKTYRLTAEQLNQCIEDGVNYIVNAGKAMNESNIKRYTMTAAQRVEHIAPIEEREARFRSECAGLKDGNNDQQVTEFYYYFTQPSQKVEGKMLFETFAAWDTRTQFIMFLERHGNG